MFIELFTKGNKMTAVKIHNGGNYVRLAYLTCWGRAVLRDVTASSYLLDPYRRRVHVE